MDPDAASSQGTPDPRQPNQLPLQLCHAWTTPELEDAEKALGCQVLPGGSISPRSATYDAARVLILQRLHRTLGDSVGLCTPDEVPEDPAPVWVWRPYWRSSTHVAASCRCHPYRCPHAAPNVVVTEFDAPAPTPDEVDVCLGAGQRLFFLTPRFSAVSGALFGGALTYHYHGGAVVGRWRGTGTSETYDLPLYLWGGALRTRERTVKAVPFGSVGDLCLLELREVDYIPDRAGLWRGLVEGSPGTFSVPPIAGPTGRAVQSDLVEWEGSVVSVYGPLLVHQQGRREPVVLDTTVVMSSATRMIGEPRNPDTWRGLVRHVRREVDKCAHLPVDHKPKVVLLSALYAFTAFAGPELYGLTAVATRDMSTWRAHADALQFRFRWLLSPAEIAAAVGTGVVGAAAGHAWLTWTTVGAGTVLHPGAPTTMMMLASKGAAVGSVAAPGLGTVAGAVLGVAFGAAVLAASKVMGYGPDPSGRPLPGPGHSIHADDQEIAAKSAPVEMVRYAKHAATELVNRVVPPQRDGTKVDASSVREPVRSSPAMALEGIGFDGHSQTYFASTPDNEAQALLSRLTRERPESDEGAVLDGFHLLTRGEWYGRYVTLVGEGDLKSTAGNFARWVARYPKNVQSRFRLARSEVMARGYFTGQEKQSGAFVKRECMEVGAKLKDPRSITTFSDANHSIQGPMIFAAQRTFVESLRNDDGSLGYLITGEVSAEEFGLWEQRALDACSTSSEAAWIVSGDGSRFDRCVDEDHDKSARDIAFPGVPFSRLELEALSSLAKVKGYSRHGVKFEAQDVMGSGDDKTALWDTLINASGQCYAFGATPGPWFWLAVQGDDMKAIFHPVMFRFRPREDFLDLLATRMRSFGFEYEYHMSQDPSQHDFCATIVYPTADGPVAGPVVGRALSRSGWHLDWSNDGNQSLRSMAIGRLQDAYHVPFLREYFERTLELAEGPLGGRPKPGIHAARRHEYSPEVWEILHRRYGLTTEDHRVFCGLLRQVSSLPAVITWDVLTSMVQRDAS